jgi:glutamate/tyrosine decarboxylase-like PLP-dependent enzyme
MVVFADETDLHESFPVGVPYMQAGDGPPNLGEVSVQGTRHADVLKTWLAIQHLGRRGIEQLVDESYRLTDRLTSTLGAREGVRLATDPDMNVVCFRVAPDWCDPAATDDLTTRLGEFLLREREVFVSRPTYRGRTWLRVVLLNPYADEAVLDRLVDGVDEFLRHHRPD